MDSSSARSTRSVWVVALDESERAERAAEGAPERIPDDEKCNVGLVGASEDGVALRLDHVSVGHDERSAVEGFLVLREPMNKFNT